jgi:hypothetical protein
MSSWYPEVTPHVTCTVSKKLDGTTHTVHTDHRTGMSTQVVSTPTFQEHKPIDLLERLLVLEARVAVLEAMNL